LEKKNFDQKKNENQFFAEKDFQILDLMIQQCSAALAVRPVVTKIHPSDNCSLMDIFQRIFSFSATENHKRQ
jgi:hypothetical protein